MKNIRLIILLLVVLLVSGCSNVVYKSQKSDSENIYMEAEANYMTFEEVVKYSDTALVGEFKEKIDHGMYVEFAFYVKRVIYGSVTEEVIYVYREKGIVYVEGEDYQFSYREDEDIYQEGKEYILITNKLENILYDHDRYCVVTQLLLCEEDDTYLHYNEKLNFESADELINYIRKFHEKDYTTFATLNEKVYENDIQEISDKAEYIGNVSILSCEIDGTLHNGNTYRCSVQELYKGNQSSMNTYEDGTILLVIKKDAVNIGEDYIIGFDSVDTNSRIYQISTLTAVFDESNEVKDQLEMYLHE